MEMMKHTPGPWTSSEFDVGRDRHIRSEKRHWSVCAVHSMSGCTDPMLDIQEAERDANARLIAAAPELLAALKALVFNSTHGNGLEAHYQALDNARAAIAKATGEVHHD